MSEWISTGQMIDSLQVGQVAEAENSEFTVTRGENGQILVNNNPEYQYPLTLNFKTLEQQWRIIHE
jgi:hypothetical protein